MSTISLLATHDYAVESLRPALETLLDPLGGMAAYVKPGDRVLLKPNLLTGSRPGQECITRPEVVACVAAMVKAVGGKP
ncbi:MAG: thylakoid-associated protein, partial [Synechocystis sp.]|nr:thylakoid-associated protein [Synechocystis sp.]